MDDTFATKSSIEGILFRYPELKNGNVGPCKITALQVAAANLKTGCDLDIKKLIRSDYKNINTEDVLGRTPLFYAVVNENVELLEYLIQNRATTDGKFRGLEGILSSNEDQKWKKLVAELPLLDAKQIDWTPLHIAIQKSCVEAVRILIEHNAEIDVTSAKVKSPLHMAFDIVAQSKRNVSDAERKSRECFRILLHKKHGMNGAAVDNKTIFTLLRNVPRPASFLKELFDMHINYTQDNSVELTYRILHSDAGDRNTKKFDEMKIILAILAVPNKIQKREILQHPLVETFLLYKWRKIKKFFLAFLLFYFIFVLQLSIFILLLRYEVQDHLAIVVFNCLLIGNSAAFSMQAVTQMLIVPKRIHREFEMLLNVFASVSSLIISIASIVNQYEEMPEWLLHLSSFTIFVAWTQLMLLMGRFNFFGLYPIMFSCVLQNILKVLVTFSCLVFGFAISFAIQFRDCEDFSNPGFAIVKTVLMMMGEYDYANLFASNTPGNVTRIRANGSLPDCSYLDGTSRIILLIFIVLVSIVLINLMIGVAVSDIQELKKTGHVKKLKKKAEFFRQLEVYARKICSIKMVPEWIKRLFDFSVKESVVVNRDDEQVIKILANGGISDFENYSSTDKEMYKTSLKHQNTLQQNLTTKLSYA